MKKIIGFALLAVILIGGLFIWYWGKSYDFLVPNRERTEDGKKIETVFPYSKEWINILVVGSDRTGKTYDAGRSDTIMVVGVDLKNKKINMLSIPRDTRVVIPGRKYASRINEAYSVGGVEKVKETVEGLLQIPIDYYAETNFEGFKEVVDILGGVEIDVEERMKAHTHYDNIDLQPGLQTLNGADALGYVRFRYNAAGDFGRAERQQKFLIAVAKKMTKPSNITKLPALMEQMENVIDTDLTIPQILRLAKDFAGITPEDVQHALLPVSGEYINGASYQIINQDEMEELVKQLFYPQAAEDMDDGKNDAGQEIETKKRNK